MSGKIRLVFSYCAVVMAFMPSLAFAIAPWSLFINTNNAVVVTDPPYNAIGDGITTNTVAIQNAINAVAVGGLTNGLRGGLVRIPPGIYLCGPLAMKSNVRLQIDSGATLRLLPYGAYPGFPYSASVTSFISGSSITNLAVTGLGAIDGQGEQWWRVFETNSGISRPAIVFLPSCSKVLLQDFTSSNPPNVHISIKGTKAGSINFIGLKLLAPSSDDPVNPSHNTDGVDFAQTNALFQDCIISTGDDNIAIGSSSSVSADMLVTNCFFGEGHGLSIGSFTSGGVSNLTVISCLFSNTGNGIKVKSSRDRGGIVQNLNYFDIYMTNVDWPIQLYSYYEFGLGTLTTVTPIFAASTAFNNPNPSPYSPPIFRNITISNVTANILNGRPPLLIWGLPDHPISNVTLKSVTLGSSSTRISGIYNATNLQFIDCRLTTPGSVKTLQLWNADITFTNGVPLTNVLALDGLTTNGIGSTLDFYNTQATVSNTNAIAGGALTFGSSKLAVNNNLILIPASPLNYVLGSNATTLAVSGNLTLGGTVNIAAGAGFTNGVYPLITYTGTLGGSLPMLGSTPPGYNYAFSTAASGQLQLLVTLPQPGTPANLSATATNLAIDLDWSAATDANGYNLKRSLSNGGPYSPLVSLTTTNYTDLSVLPGTTYYYIVTATNSASESGDSPQASAMPLPSSAQPNLDFVASPGQLDLSWPSDHIGWRLQIQTNDLGAGLSTNWFDVDNVTQTNHISIPVDSDNGSVFLRLVYQ